MLSRMGGVGTGRQRAGDRAWKGLRRASELYGWRLYAVPVLAVITVVVIVQTVYGSSRGKAAAPEPGPAAAEHPSPSEHPSNQSPNELKGDLPAAALPPGGHITRHGSGHWHIVPGTTPKVGTAKKVYTYTVEVEGGLHPSDYGGSKAFARMVQQTLSDRRSWIGGGRVSFRRVDSHHAHPDVRISLTSPGTDHRADVCGYSIHYETSCYRSDTHRVVINLARWVRGAVAFGGDMPRYRRYVINHEVGHALGHRHKGCRTQGGPAPVMMEQTLGVSDDYVAKLNRKMPGNRHAVRPDGKTCKANPWPHPHARPGLPRGEGPHAGSGR
jgi:hypothetical protein